MGERKQINLRADDELLDVIGQLQRLDNSGPRPPSMSDVIRKALIETLDRWQKAKRRK